MSASRRGYRSALFVRGAFGAPDFYLAVEPLASVLFTLLSGGKCSAKGVVHHLGNINIGVVDEKEMPKQD